MTSETQQASAETTEIPFGAKLQQARESMNLDRKDAAAQLRLNEKYINMMEEDELPKEMPAIFKRGYIRAYGKLLRLSEDTIAEGLAPIHTDSRHIDTSINIPIKVSIGKNKHKYIKHAVTAVIALTIVWLLASWWSGHNSKISTTQDSKAIAVSLPEKSKTAPISQSVVKAALNGKSKTLASTKTKQASSIKPPMPVKIKKALPSPLGTKPKNMARNDRSYDEEDDYYYD